MNSYQRRDDILKHLGYASYAAYLESDTWKAIRLRVLKKDRWTCRRCGGRASQVHHGIYDIRILRGQSLRGLTSVCDMCHKHGEFEGAAKCTNSQANDRIGVKLKKTQRIWRRKNGYREDSWELIKAT